MKQLMVKKGQVILEETPSPFINEDEVLVQVYYSCISSGTELSSIKRSSESTYQKVFNRPENVKLILDFLRTQGPTSLIERARAIESAAFPIGYSASGIVLQVGKNIKDIAAGERVACAGAGIANHAEFIAVPRNLLVKVPHSLSTQLASTVTMGSIAIQGLRRANVHLGELVAVIGMGMLGQLTAQLLKINGCCTLVIDNDQRRIDKALILGADQGVNVQDKNILEETKRFSNGYGVDAVIITAASTENNIINDAMKMCRKKGRVVIVGDVGLHLKREEFYKKELDVLISTSYGPGRYDDDYELKGIDYPYAYVRWTENRNMEAYLKLLTEKRLLLDELIEKTCQLNNAPQLYEELQSGKDKPIIILIEYNKEAEPSTKSSVTASFITKNNIIKVGLIGCGEFAQSVILPTLMQLKEHYEITAIAGRTGSKIKALSHRYGARYATTDYHQILNDPSINMVVIAVRHHLHAPMAIAAAQAGKAIFLEKPMALNHEELEQLVKSIETSRVPFIIGYNRRFSPYIQKIKQVIKNNQGPFIINYRMNAGFIPRDHWIHGKEGGGRNIGEACHIYDLFNFFTESEVKDIHAVAINSLSPQYGKNDNFVATINYQSGSICNLVYTALGSTAESKEQMDIYFNGKIIKLDDYKSLEFVGLPHESPSKTIFPSKGHKEEFLSFANSLKNQSEPSIPLWMLIQSSFISFKVEELIQND